ncbi:hypothetical protein fugu_014933 [Takifugu bimaculatus]|uniref:Uncharacterized protein n=1 Tax=Takifugu bimaculatus TaxID=433685 RepID=A0A4Z2BXZ9_9TELE|nr:hypothetical protein fugu_014933 [Takifugu bimaculatus]
MGLHVTVKLFNPQAALRSQQLSYTDVNICKKKKKNPFCNLFSSCVYSRELQIFSMKLFVISCHAVKIPPIKRLTSATERGMNVKTPVPPIFINRFKCSR